MWMMVLTFTMMMQGQSVQVGEVTVHNFANQPDCLAKMATVVLQHMDTAVHNVSVTCQSQPH